MLARLSFSIQVVVEVTMVVVIVTEIGQDQISGKGKRSATS